MAYSVSGCIQRYFIVCVPVDILVILPSVKISVVFGVKKIFSQIIVCVVSSFKYSFNEIFIKYKTTLKMNDDAEALWVSNNCISPRCVNSWLNQDSLWAIYPLTLEQNGRVLGYGILKCSFLDELFEFELHTVSMKFVPEGPITISHNWLR